LRLILTVLRKASGHNGTETAVAATAAATEATVSSVGKAESKTYIPLTDGPRDFFRAHMVN
jgi:hypothetical protein